MGIRTIIAAALLTIGTMAAAQTTKKTDKSMEKLNLEQEWDKTFQKSEKVDHKKVTFQNSYGITLAADMYTPKDASGKLPAIAVSGPFGAVKEQASGLYAQTLAERGFVTIAFDPSFTGESGGQPRWTASPDINTEDFMAAVDFLTVQPDVDVERVGILGICGWGGIAINAASIDPRIKATVASTMYDMTRVGGNGYFDADNSEEARHAIREKWAAERTLAAKNGHVTPAGALPEKAPEGAPQFVVDYVAYYKTPRGYHKRSGNSNNGWHTYGTQAYMNGRFLYYSNEIRSAVMVMHGEKAHSLYFGKDAYKYMVEGKPEAGIKPNPRPENKELLIIPGASHTDLYDQTDIIPFDKIEKFYRDNMK